MISQQIRDILKKRKKLYLNDDFGVQECWMQLTNILSEDINSTISFILNECTDGEFFWLSEVFEEVARTTKSVDFVSAITKRIEAVHASSYNQKQFDDAFIRDNIDYDTYISSIRTEIEYAEGAIQDGLTPST